ncbi:MAG: orotidine-5'-phosphate decarboxylase [Methylococcales bacterium]|jgi:orotidine-5'-phosphate decarboxylase|nr:orotidine-5'-phosphate decarboxylase [Methylococcales bacterium]MBT7443219.1 orotidine-5'-phosphate decarboxylase [Methylococcales bacterium]
MTDSKIIVALDYADKAQALNFVDRITPDRCKLKVGKEMFTRFGPGFVEQLVGKGYQVFLDLKYHDIPNTVARACEAAADLGVWMVNVHAAGGRAMMTTAKEALVNYSHQPLLISVTILTSLSEEEVVEIGYTDSIENQVKRFALLAEDCGLDGVVCSPKEIEILRQSVGVDFQLVTPGIRPASASVDDQKRIMTPDQAISTGASYLVIGRPITKAEDPIAVLDSIAVSLK